MEKEKIITLKTSFDSIANIISSEDYTIEYWRARDLMQLLGYNRWENFNNAIQRAMESCATSGIEVSPDCEHLTEEGHRQIADLFHDIIVSRP